MKLRIDAKSKPPQLTQTVYGLPWGTLALQIAAPECLLVDTFEDMPMREEMSEFDARDKL